MKKIILSAILVMGLALSANAQENVLYKGGMVANLGVGIPQMDEGYKPTLPPISASWEYGVAEFGRPGSIGVGAYVGFWGYKDEASISGLQSVAHKYFNTVIGARAAYHFTLVKGWEIYAGGVLGAKIKSEKLEADGVFTGSSDAEVEVGFGYQAFAGTRFLFSDSVGAFVEAGYGVSYATAGLTFRF